MTPSVATFRHGPTFLSSHEVEFRLWAPACEHVELVLSRDETATAIPMTRRHDGWHEVLQERTGPGALYQFRLPNGLMVPDPASRFQPADVHGPSELVDVHSWVWEDKGWHGRPWYEAVVYELHVGAFTEPGTFLEAIEKLDHLVQVGVTAIELMPIGDFPGQRNWGYDGVLPYAPDSSYGRPEDLKKFVEECHARGLMVLLDVVYNHFGPEGCYQHEYAPGFFDPSLRTPWGGAIDFSDPSVRDFFVQNAIYWVRDFHLDGLRLDAVHSIHDRSERHILTEIAEEVRAAVPDRLVHLLLENEENEARWLERDADGQPRFYTAQWNDDVHHAFHTAATQEGQGYYREYLGRPKMLARALAEGFSFQGEVMEYRGTARGERCGHLPPTAFVSFLQNHDQIGNRAFGDRLHGSVRERALKAITTAMLLSPQIPMLFMGEEWGAQNPFPFFCDFPEPLAQAVREGRRAEFSRFPEFTDPEAQSRIPDPTARATFAAAKLDWSRGSEFVDWYTAVLRRRREAIVPLLPGIRCGGRYQVSDAGVIEVRWAVEDGPELVLVGNFSDCSRRMNFARGQLVWSEGIDGPGTAVWPPWSVAVQRS